MKTILVLTDFSKKSEHAANFALHLAEHLKSDLCLYNTFTPPDINVTSRLLNLQTKENIEHETKKRLAALADDLIRQSEENDLLLVHPRVSYLCMEGDVSDLGNEIGRIVSEKNIGMIVMGAKGEECLSNFIPGTETYSVIMNATCPVLFIPEEAKIDKIDRLAIITDDGGEHENKLLIFLNEFQKNYQTEVLFTRLGFAMEEIIEVSSQNSIHNKRNNRVKNIDENELADQLQEVTPNKPIDILGVMFRRLDEVLNKVYLRPL